MLSWFCCNCRIRFLTIVASFILMIHWDSIRLHWTNMDLMVLKVTFFFHPFRAQGGEEWVESKWVNMLFENVTAWKGCRYNAIQCIHDLQRAMHTRTYVHGARGTQHKIKIQTKQKTREKKKTRRVQWVEIEPVYKWNNFRCPRP